MTDRLNTLAKSIIPIIIPAYEPCDRFVQIVYELRELTPVIVIVDDGSDGRFRKAFDTVERIDGVIVLCHALNLGKGRSLKDAFNYVLDKYPDTLGVVTVDADGQHVYDDIWKIMEALRKEPSNLILGCREFDGNTIPWKSKFGNNMTRKVLAYLCEVRVSDTQTGLRGIPLEFIKVFLYTPGERYEYETNMLLECNNVINIREIPIQTIYDSRDNHKTHFDPLRDSITIYKVIMSYSFSSVLATIIDYIIFSLMTWKGCSIWGATGVARVVAAFSNFLLNRNVVFRSRDDAGKQFLKYALLVIVSGLLSASIINGIHTNVQSNLIIIKAIVEAFLFFFNYYVQRSIVFAKRKGEEMESSTFSESVLEKTDWTKYYQGKKSWISSFTQRFTLKSILYALETYVVKPKKINICEMGGGNSCFCEKICTTVPVNAYDIIDNNKLAVKLFSEKKLKVEKQKGICMDLLSIEGGGGSPDYDFVYSIGLIEHFRGDDIKTLIKRHFDYCKCGGIVLIAFPTPTKKYRVTRKCMELVGAWQFYDEKPICFEEISDCFEKYGTILEHFINHKLPLTQEVVISRKGDVMSS